MLHRATAQSGNLHQEDNCIIQNLDVTCEFNQEHYLNYFQPMNFAVVIGTIMCCPDSFRTKNQLVRMKDGVMTSLFMHQDSWGQYGPSQDLDVTQRICIWCARLDDNSFCQLPAPEPDINNLNDAKKKLI